MRTMGDAIREYAKWAHDNSYSTTDGIRLLEIENIPRNIAAGNLFLVALEMIYKLQKQNEELEKIIAEKI